MLEKTVRLALETINIKFIQEAKIGRYSVDFLLSNHRIALEVDGTYWHQDLARDTRKTKFLNSHGWRVIRISDVEIKNAPNLGSLITNRIKV